MKIRECLITDLKEIAEIYNNEVEIGTATFETKVVSNDKWNEWFYNHKDKNFILIAESCGKCIGWISLSKWIEKSSCENMKELSLYINSDFRGRGIGTLLMKECIKKAKILGIENIVSLITDGNENSIQLHKKFDFEFSGVIKKASNKFNKSLNLLIMQKII